MLITGPAAGGEFPRGLLSAAYGGAVLTGGLAAVPAGRLADRHGVRWLIAGGALAGAAGLLAFAAAAHGWQVLALWWLVLGPATALTFYEPAYVAIQQAFAPEARAQAIAALTLTAGLSGPVFIPATGALVEAIGWRDATRILAAGLACAAPIAIAFVRTAPHRQYAGDRTHAGWRPNLAPFRERRLLLFTAAAVLAYGATEAIVVHRVARFQELGFSLGTVTFWAGVSGLVTLPGRFLLPVLARRVRGSLLLAAVFGVLAASTGLMIAGNAEWQMIASFMLFGLVFGAALPLRAVLMGEWTATAVFGAVMGVQAAAMAVGRAALPALTGGLHDRLGDYTAAIALLCALLIAAVVLVIASDARPVAAPRRELMPAGERPAQPPGRTSPDS